MYTWFLFHWRSCFLASQHRCLGMAPLVRMNKTELNLIKHIMSRLRYKLNFCFSKRHDSNKYWYLRIHSSTSAGSQTFSTVQFEYQKGKLPFSNLLPFGHLYLENSLSYHNQPPSSIGGGRSAQGSTEINFMRLDFCLQYIKRPHLTIHILCFTFEIKLTNALF